jgi:hypothetical protein
MNNDPFHKSLLLSHRNPLPFQKFFRHLTFSGGFGIIDKLSSQFLRRFFLPAFSVHPLCHFPRRSSLPCICVVSLTSETHKLPLSEATFWIAADHTGVKRLCGACLRRGERFLSHFLLFFRFFSMRGKISRPGCAYCVRRIMRCRFSDGSIMR